MSNDWKRSRWEHRGMAGHFRPPQEVPPDVSRDNLPQHAARCRGRVPNLLSNQEGIIAKGRTSAPIPLLLLVRLLRRHLVTFTARGSTRLSFRDRSRTWRFPLCERITLLRESRSLVAVAVACRFKCSAAFPSPRPGTLRQRSGFRNADRMRPSEFGIGSKAKARTRK